VILPLFFRIEGKPVPEIMDREHNNLLKETFRIFYEKHSAGFLNFIRKSCGGDEGEAGDIFQESFFKLFRSSPHGLNEYQMKAWLYKTAYRLIIDAKRKKKHDTESPENIQAADSSVHDKELPIDMDRAFRKLRGKERTLLWMAYVEGYTHREIARITGVREKSLKVTLFRIRKKFASILEWAGYEGVKHGN